MPNFSKSNTVTPDPLRMANIELAFQNEDRRKRAAELDIANEELAYQNEEKEKRAAELIIANKELAFQNAEKEKRALELVIANRELIFQNEEKEKRAAELIIANRELIFQNEEKEKLAAELIIANKELLFQNEEKEKRAVELIVAYQKLVYQNEEREKRAAELVIANKELLFQNQEKEKMAAALVLAEAERTKMVADIVQRNKDLEQFSYIISHNLRAPVANISGVTQLLQMPGIDRYDEKNFMQDLSLSVKKLDDVIMDLNYILQLKNSEDKKREQVKFSELLNDITLSLSDLITSNDVEIISDFSIIDEIPTLKTYLYSIFLNLITNSVKYRRQDATPVIEITSQMLRDKIQLNFKDNGLGIDLGTRGDQVFGLYKRFHNHVEGKGMGLFMVKTQVESMGGKISIMSEVNKGTEFKIEFELN